MLSGIPQNTPLNTTADSLSQKKTTEENPK
jgi:hypothetical protein